MNYALHIVEEEPDTYRWVLLEIDGENLIPNTHSDCEYGTYADALNAGTLALAAADGQPYENEAADPVGDADCAAAVEPLG